MSETPQSPPAGGTPRDAADACGGLARRLTRRDLALRALRGCALWGAGWLGSLLIAASLMGWGDPILWLAAGLWAVALALAAGWLAFRRRRAESLLWAADRQVQGEEQLITAHELSRADPAHPMLPLLLRRCEPLLRRVDVRRLLPLRPGRPEAAAAAFLVLAVALYWAIPPLSEQVARVLPRAEGPLAEQAQRLERLAAEWEALALDQGFARLGTLAGETKQTALTLQEDDTSRETGMGLLQALVKRADALAAATPEPEPEEEAGEVAQLSSPGAEAEGGLAASEDAFVARSPKGGSGTELPPADIQDDEPLEADPELESIPITVPSPWSQDLSARAENLPQTPTRRNLQETYLVQIAAEELRQAVRELNRMIEAAEGTPTPAPPRETAEAASTARDDLPAPSEGRPTDEGEAFGRPMPGDMGRYGEMDETASGTSGTARPTVKPGEVGYVDQSVRGRGEAESQEQEWVEREPQPETRRTEPAAFTAELQRATLHAEGRGEIGREHWALLKAYQDNLRAIYEQAPAPPVGR